MAHEGAAVPVKVVALCGSLSEGSYHKGLIQVVMDLSKGAIECVESEEVDITALPMLNTDLEEDGSFPAEVEVFRQKILEADSVLFASPKYNYSTSAPMKNALDWASGPLNVWGGKAATIVSTGGMFSGGRGQSHLHDIGVFFDLHFLNKPEFFHNAFLPPSKCNPLNDDLIDEDVILILKQTSRSYPYVAR